MQQSQGLIAAQALAGAYDVGPTAPVVEAGHALARNHTESLAVVQGGLEELGVPRGLARQIAEDDHRIGLRIYLLDNSGSTTKWDGKVLDEDAVSRRCSLRQTTRWEEICTLARDHARWNLAVGTPCEFLLLNSRYRAAGDPIVPDRDSLRVDGARGSEAEQLQRLAAFLQHNEPRGVTPLADRLEDIGAIVDANLRELALRNQVVFVVVVTDGLPTSRFSGESTQKDRADMVVAMKRLFALGPVHMVIRLCTDEDETIEFYNAIDRDEELPLDILDDIGGEAAEVDSKRNGWFAYSPLIHRIREAGTLCSIFDDIDEGPLHLEQVRVFARMLLDDGRRPVAGLSDEHLVREARRAAQEPGHLVFDARRMSMRPAVDASRLRVALRVSLFTTDRKSVV